MKKLEVLCRGPLTSYAAVHRLPLRRVCRLLYAADLHLSPWTTGVVAQMLEMTERWRPDVVALGGDLVDAPWALSLLSDMVRELRRFAPVLAIPGNHDMLVGLPKMAEAVRRGGGVMLEEPWHHQASDLWVHGQLAGGQANSVLIAHNPLIFPRAARAGLPLVLAGHLHGCQMILWEAAGMQYPGAWFYRYNGREFFHSSPTSRMIVTLGVNDTLPLRWNCPREVILMEIRP